MYSGSPEEVQVSTYFEHFLQYNRQFFKPVAD
jgi:hypothetical protein